MCVCVCVCVCVYVYVCVCMLSSVIINHMVIYYNYKLLCNVYTYSMLYK